MYGPCLPTILRKLQAHTKPHKNESERGQTKERMEMSIDINNYLEHYQAGFDEMYPKLMEAVDRYAAVLDHLVKTKSERKQWALENGESYQESLTADAIEHIT